VTDELKDAFRHLWDKAAYQCKILKKEINKRYPALIVLPGHGALDADEHDSTDKEPGAPDLFVWYNQRLICAIEVTGSDKIETPWNIWIGKHKIDFAKKAEYPIGFFFFYGKYNQVRFFTSYEEIESVLDPPEVRTIRGLNLEYHILEYTYFKDERGFWDWFHWCLEERIETTSQVIE